MAFSLENLKPQDFKKVKIIVDRQNYLLPRNYNALLQVFVQRETASLHLNIEEHQDYSIYEYLTQFCKIFINHNHNFKEFYLRIMMHMRPGLRFSTILINMTRDALLFDESGIQLLSNLLMNTVDVVRELRLNLGANNAIREGMTCLTKLIIKHQKSITLIHIDIGQDSQLKCSGLTEFIQTLLVLNKLETLSVHIGGSNSLDQTLLTSLLSVIYQSSLLRTLDFEVGNSTKIFQKELTTEHHGFHKLEIIRFKIGKMNNFNNPGAFFLSKLISSNRIKILDIYVGELNQIDKVQSLYIFSMIEQIKTLEKLALSFEKKMYIDDECILMLSNAIRSSQKIKSVEINLSQQQNNKEHCIYNLLESISTLKYLVQLDLQFGGELHLGRNLSKLSNDYFNLQFLNTVSIKLRGDNFIDYKDLKLFLQGIRQSPNLKSFQFINSQQYPSSRHKTELTDNQSILRNICFTSDTPILTEYRYLNEQIYFFYNFVCLKIKLSQMDYLLESNLITELYKYRPTQEFLFECDSKITELLQVLMSVLLLLDFQEKIHVNIFQVFEFSKIDQYVLLKLDGKNKALENASVQGIIQQITIPIDYVDIENFELSPFTQSSIMMFMMQIQSKSQTRDRQFTFKFNQNKLLQLDSSEELQFVFQQNSVSHQDTFNNLCTTLGLLRDIRIKQSSILIFLHNTDVNWQKFFECLSHNDQIYTMKLQFLSMQVGNQTLLQYLEYYFGLLKMVVNCDRLISLNDNYFIDKKLDKLFRQANLMNQPQPQPQNPIQQLEEEEEEEQDDELNGDQQFIGNVQNNNQLQANNNFHQANNLLPPEQQLLLDQQQHQNKLNAIQFGLNCRYKAIETITKRRRLIAQIIVMKKKLGVGLKKDMIVDLLEMFI